LKILLIHTHYQYRGGEDAVVSQEMDFLKQYHDVEVLYFKNKGGLKGAIQFFSSIWNTSVSRKIVQKVLDFQPDIVHVHNWHFAIGPLFIREINKLGIPIVQTVHNYRLLCPSGILYHKGQLFTKSLIESFPWSAVRKKVYRSSLIQTFWLAFIVWFHKKIGTWKKIDVYVCLTPFCVDVFQKSNFGISKEKFIVKPNFTPHQNQIEFKGREKHFLFIGRLSTEKGIEIVLNAFKNSAFNLKIAGDGFLKNSIIEAEKECSNINYLGNLNSDRVAEEMQKAQALIFPSVWYEGMPMTIIEAFSHGTPVIASNIGAMTSMISNEFNGFLFECGNKESLIQNVTRFNTLSSSEKHQLSSNAFQEYRTKYSKELQKEFFETIYNIKSR
jgi:glycosyltransferase involved in cell wall biosynthesis